jgi:hypothetical protein
VGWKVSEEDVRFTCAGGGDWDASIKATTPMRRVFDVNNRASAWDVYTDMVRLGVFSLSDISFRIEINDPDKGPIFSTISFDRLPRPPLRLEGSTVSRDGENLRVAFRKMLRPEALPAYSERDYKIELDFLSAQNGRFRKAKRADGEGKPQAFLWDHRQSVDPLAKGTWVRLVVTRRNDPQSVGFALFRIHLKPGHPFFSDEEY